MTRLIPVAEWVWILFKVQYHVSEDSPAEERYDQYIVSTDTHIQGEVCEGDMWPSPHLKWASWEPLFENVRPSHKIGSMYGMPIYESGWSAGEREAKERGLLK